MSIQKTTVVGASLPRVDVREKIVGTAQYVDDYRLPGMLHCALVLSPHPHAEVISIDTTPAKSMPGVVAVLTGADIPGLNQIGCVFQDQPLLATDKVRFVGDRIAVVAAESREEARAAAARVEVSYQVLPGLYDARDALANTEVKIHTSGNLVTHQKVRKGAGAEGFKDCDVVVEKEFFVNYQEHAYLEPQGALAVPELDGSLTVMGSMQCPFYVQGGVARVLGMDKNQVRVIQTVTGGAFGGKEDYPSEVAAVPAVVAVKTGRPAKLIYTRAEDLQLSTKRHRMRMLFKVGAHRDGTLQVLHVQQWVDAGGYNGLSTVVAERANTTAGGPYRFPDAHVDTYIVYTNNLFGGAFRGFGNPQVTFAMENMMDLLAAELELDPVALRRQNLLREGDLSITGQVIPASAPSIEMLDTLVEQSDYANLVREAKAFNQSHRWQQRGVGMALSMYGCCLHAGGQHMEGSGALVQVRSDGSVEVSIGGTELGQGAFTVMAQIAAEVLGADYARVKVLPSDTRMVPDSGPTVASRTTIMSGNATRGASLQLRARLVALAADLMGCEGHDVTVSSNSYASKDRQLTFGELCNEAFRRKLNLFASGWYAPPPKDWDKATGQGTAYVTYCFTGHVALVEVDLVGGLPKVLKVFATHDIGKVMNPALAEGQVHGGIVQGMGWGLSENLILDQGRCLNPGFTDYLIPCSLDMPEMDVRYIEAAYPDGPYGAKGLGEPSLISVPTAVAIAAANAVGQRPERLPVTPEDILRWSLAQA
jgi:CO/xanthine dehydrogenase Mo-binding subunit